LTTGYARGTVFVLLGFSALTIASWALRPPDRRVHGASVGA
jgi:hypothetical protein